MEIFWREVALNSLERARTCIAQDNPSAAQRVYERILSAVRNLADMPQMGRPGRVEDTRELVVPDTPYIVAYRVREGVVEILAVIHGAQQRPTSF